MEQERKKPVQRDPKGLRSAQRRKEIREEKARLEKLREQQQRKAKRRTVKRINKGVYKRLVIMGGIVLAVVLSMVIFFRVQHIEIRGTGYYTQEEIRQACGVMEGDNLLLVPRTKIVGRLTTDAFKYISHVKVSRQLPDTLIIEVTEGNPRYAVSDTEGQAYLITAEGKVLETLGTNSMSEYVVVEGLTIEKPEIGEEITVYAPEGEEINAKGQLSALKKLLVSIEAAGLGRQIASVRVPSSFRLSVWYQDRFEVDLGNTDRLDYKLAYLKAVVEQEESYVTGKIDLTLTDGDKAFLLRDE